MVYLIVGASGDIGKALIRRIDNMSEEKDIIIAHCNKNMDSLRELEIQLKKTKLRIIKSDLSTEEGAGSLADKVIELISGEAVSKLDRVVFLPAAPLEYIKFKDFSIERFQRNIQISVNSFLVLSQKLLPVMCEKSKTPSQTKKSIVVMLSKVVEVNIPPKFMTEYVVSKYALLGAVKALRAEYSSKIKINSVSPGMTDTAFLREINPRIIEMIRESEGRLLEPDMVADMIIEAF